MKQYLTLVPRTTDFVENVFKLSWRWVNITLTEQRANVGNGNSYRIPLPKSSVDKKRYYPIRTSFTLGLLLKKSRKRGTTNSSFIKAVVLGRIVNLFKWPLTELSWISNLSANAIFLWYNLFFPQAFLHFGSIFSFFDTNNNFKNLIMKKLRNEKFKELLKIENRKRK